MIRNISITAVGCYFSIYLVNIQVTSADYIEQEKNNFSLGDFGTLAIEDFDTAM